MATYRHAKGASASRIVMIILIVVLSVAILGGAAFAVYHFAFDKENTEPTVPTETLPPATVEEPATEAPTEDPDLKFATLAQEYMSTMTDDEKIYQMIIATPEALTGVDVATVAGDATKEAIVSQPVGGIIYAEDNFEDANQTTELISNSQSYAQTPMFIAVAEEGGDNSPVATKLDDTTLNNMSTYEKDGEATAHNNARSVANYLTKYGFNLNLAPIANLEGDNAYSADAETSATLISQAVSGFQTNGVISTIKQFPISSDTDKSADELRATEFLPFTAGINQGTGIVMLSSAKATTIDSDNPAFMSQRIVTELLLKELKFNGVVMTPVLSDSAITDAYTTEQIVTNSINAGANLLLAPSDIDEYVEAIKTAIDNKTITQQQIDESVTKILTLKFKYGIISDTTSVTPTTESTETATIEATE